jgi:molybdate transport system substrate-binding protein
MTENAFSFRVRAGRRLLGAVLATAAFAAPACAQDLTVFAAASLQNALEDVSRQYQAKSGRTVRFSFASSAVLARQIEQGAPAAIFASADEQWMDYLAKANLIVPESRRTLLGNRLVMVAPAGTTTRVDLRPGFDFAALLGADGRWATGDPASVPVGRYAQEALTHLGVWNFAQTRLVRTENVRVALAYVERAEVPIGIVYETDAAISPKVRVAGVFPADSHKPVTYPFALIAKNDSAAAREFLEFLNSSGVRETWRRHGFSTP